MSKSDRKEEKRGTERERMEEMGCNSRGRWRENERDTEECMSIGERNIG